MRHRKNTVKLGRTSSQREALFASLVSNLILAKRIKTTLAKARAAKRMADKMVTVGKKGTLAARRQALVPAQAGSGGRRALRRRRPGHEGSRRRLHPHHQARASA